MICMQPHLYYSATLTNRHNKNLCLNRERFTVARHFAHSKETKNPLRSQSLTQTSSGANGSGAYRFQRPQRSHKPQKQAAKGLVIAIILVVIILVAVFAAFQLFFDRQSQDKASQATQTSFIEVEIPQGAGAQSIAQLLYEKGVISSPTMFIDELVKAGADSKLRPGTYQFSTQEDTQALINKLLQGGEVASKKLSIPEGLTLKQVAAQVEKQLGISAQSFIDQAKASNYEEKYPFVKGTYQDSLEGYLYPKTYNFQEGITADQVIDRLLQQFVKETQGLDFSAASNKGLDALQVISAASLIERETRVIDERPLVASVIYNRLNKGMPLQIDAAIQYALGTTKQRLSLDDLKVDSPYNTYSNKGMVPGPICSPSISSIKAVLEPASSDYLYYVLTSKDGTHTFTSDYDSFKKAKEEYKRVFSS